VCLCIIGLTEDEIAELMAGLATNVKRLRAGYIRCREHAFSWCLQLRPMLTVTEQYFCVIRDYQKKGGKSGRKDSQCPLRVIKTVENTVFYPVALHSWICVCGRTMIYHQKIQNRMVLRLGLPTECHVKRPCVVHTLAHYKFRRYVKLCNLYR
jgi:hypothetical protein